MIIKKILFFLAIMLHIPALPMHRYTYPPTYTRVNINIERFDEKQVIDEIRQAYPGKRRFSANSEAFPGKYLLIDIYDTRQNILNKFSNKIWFDPNALIPEIGTH
jgi:hypothetical protein